MLPHPSPHHKNKQATSKQARHRSKKDLAPAPALAQAQKSSVGLPQWCPPRIPLLPPRRAAGAPTGGGCRGQTGPKYPTNGPKQPRTTPGGPGSRSATLCGILGPYGTHFGRLSSLLRTLRHPFGRIDCCLKKKCQSNCLLRLSKRLAFSKTTSSALTCMGIAMLHTSLK